MEDKADCFVSGPLAVTLRGAKFLGLAPLWFVRAGHGWRVSISPTLHVIGCIFVIILDAIIMAAVITEFLQSKIPHYVVTRQVVWFLDVLLAATTFTGMICGASNHMRCMVAVINQVQKITSKFCNYHSPIQWKTWKVASILSWMTLCTLVSIMDSVLFATSMRLENQSTWIKITYVVSYSCYWIIEVGMVLFILIVLHVHNTFKDINNCLRSLLRGKGTNSVDKHKAIRSISWAHAAACDMVRDLNQSFGFILIVFLASNFLALVSSPYYFINNLVSAPYIRKHNLRNFTLVEISQLIGTIFHAVNVMMIIEPCHATHSEVKCTRELISLLILHVNSPSDPLLFKLEQFYRQLMLNEVSYKPFNVILLSRGLLLTMLGSVTTYLVVLTDLNN